MTGPGPARRPSSRWIVPPAASVVVHAGLLLALTAVTIEATRERPAPRPERVTLAGPDPSDRPDADRPEPRPEAQPDAPTEPGVAARAPSAPAPAEPAALIEAVAAQSAPVRAGASPRAPAPAPAAGEILRADAAGAPTVRFADVDASPARTVVFVVDASGAAASAFTFVREELLRSIDQLSPTQRFQVIVFPGPDNADPVLAPIGGQRGALAPATPATKRAVAEWMASFRPRGESRPLAGLREALALGPDIVMLITRSIERTGPDAAWGEGLHPTLDELDELNPADRHGRRRSAIAAVQLLDADPTGIMPAIAARHGQGVSDYRVVTAETLASAQPEARTPGADPSRTADAAAAVLAELDDSGAALRVLQGLPDDADRARVREQAERAASLAGRTPDDARARVLLARARSLAGNAPLDDAIDALRDELLHDADADAWRRLAIVDALATGGRLDDALAELDALKADAAEVPVSPSVRGRLVVTEAALGREPADPDAVHARAPFVDAQGRADAYWSLALAEASVRGRLRRGASDPFEPLLRLLDRAEREGADAWRPVLADRIVRGAAIAPDRVADAPARVRMIVASAWARTPGTRDDARALLRALADDAGAPVRPGALWRLALLERGTDTPASRQAAAGLFARLATEHPDDPNAADALAGAIALTERPDDLRPLLRRAVERLPGRPEIDLWRLNLAELLDGSERLDALEAVTPGTRESTLARDLYARTAEAVHAAAEPAARGALALRAAAFLARHDAPDAPRWLTRAADAAAATDPAQGVDLARRAIELARRHDAPTTDAELALARAQLAGDRQADAVATLTALATRLDGEHDEPPHPPAFWEAWTLLLEIGGAQDPGAARAHLARLELLDPGLGGAPWAERLGAVRAALPAPGE